MSVFPSDSAPASGGSSDVYCWDWDRYVSNGSRSLGGADAGSYTDPYPHVYRCGVCPRTRSGPSWAFGSLPRPCVPDRSRSVCHSWRSVPLSDRPGRSGDGTCLLGQCTSLQRPPSLQPLGGGPASRNPGSSRTDTLSGCKVTVDLTLFPVSPDRRQCPPSLGPPRRSLSTAVMASRTGPGEALG